MVKSRLNFKDQILSREEMKNVVGGGSLECLSVGEACTGNVQCCSNNCVSSGGKTTGATCGTTT